MKENSNDNAEEIKNENKIISEEEKKGENINGEKQNEEIKENKEMKNNNIKYDNNINNEILNEKNNEIKKEKEADNVNNLNNEQTAQITTSIVKVGKEKTNDIYRNKTKELSKIFLYTVNYLIFLSELFKKISEPFYSELSTTYIYYIKPLLKYFKDLSSILSNFSDKINILNSSINPELYSSNEDNLIHSENNFNLSVKKINTSLVEVYHNISKELNEIINKPLFSKYANIETKFEENFHKMLSLISNLEQFRIKYNSDFSKKHLNNFNLFINKFNEIDNYLIKMKNFISIEYDIVNNANLAMTIAENFINEIQKLYHDSLNIFCDYLEMLKIMIKIYYKENKKIILPKILSEETTTDLEKLLSQNIRKNIEKKFSIKNIIEHYHNEKLRNEINHLLLKYQEIFSKNKIYISEDIDDISKFNLKYLKTNEIFFNFLRLLIHPKYQVNYADGIQFKTEVKRDCGLFKGWKECHLVISYQGHILFFDKENINNKKINNTIESHSVIMNNIKIRKNIGLDELNNNQFLKDNLNEEDDKFGINPNNLSIIYYKTSYGIKKRTEKQGKFLFEIWEKGIGNKKNKINIIDALNAKNLENILLELTETNIYDD